MSPSIRRRHRCGSVVHLTSCLIAVTGPASAQTAALDDEVPPGATAPARVVAPTPATARIADADADEDGHEATTQRTTYPYRMPQNAAWVEPVFPIVGLFTRSLDTNIGYSRSLSRGLDLNLQAGIGIVDQYGSQYPTGGVSLGLTVFLTGSEPMNGLFVSPRVRFDAGLDTRRGGPADFLGAGIDVGYQYAVGGFFFAPVFGLGWDAVFPVGAFSSANPPYYATRLDLAGFRIGWTFDGARGSSGERGRGIRVYSHEAHGFDIARDHRPRTIAVWTWPAWMAIGPLFNRYNVGLGVTARVDERVQFVVEGTYEWGAMPNSVTFRQANYERIDGAIGVAFMLWSGGGLTGVFLEPELYGNLFLPGAVGGFVPAFAGGFGLDLGYAFQAGPIYIAPVVGVRLGATAVASPGALSSQQPTGFTPDVNFTILRMGVGF